MATPLRTLTGALRGGPMTHHFGLTAIASSSKRTFSVTPLFRDGQRTKTTTTESPPHLSSRDSTDPSSSASSRSSASPSSTEPDPLTLAPNVTEFLSTPSYTAEGQRDTTPPLRDVAPSPPPPHKSGNSGLQSRPGIAGLRAIPVDNPKGTAKSSRYLPIEPLVLPISSSSPISHSYKPEDYQVGSTMDAPGRQGRVTHVLNVKCTRNNVHLTFVDRKGSVKNLGTISAGHGGVFKKGKRSTYEAAYQAGLKMFQKILLYARHHVVQVCVAYKGLGGQGREAIAQAMVSPEGSDFTRLVVRIEDRTPILMGGPRPKGKRNV